MSALRAPAFPHGYPWLWLPGESNSALLIFRQMCLSNRTPESRVFVSPNCLVYLSWNDVPPSRSECTHWEPIRSRSPVWLSPHIEPHGRIELPLLRWKRRTSPQCLYGVRCLSISYACSTAASPPNKFTILSVILSSVKPALRTAFSLSFLRWCPQEESNL